jgi:hypothetical protein
VSRKFEIATPGTRGLLAAAGSLQALLTLGLLSVNQISNIGATTLFALSGRADRWRTFILFQALGSSFGLLTQLSFAGMVVDPVVEDGEQVLGQTHVDHPAGCPPIVGQPLGRATDSRSPCPGTNSKIRSARPETSAGSCVT